MNKQILILSLISLLWAQHVKPNKTEAISLNIESVQQHKQKNAPLIYVEGIKVEFEDMEKIDKDLIESVTVVKDSVELKKYGKDADKGVILITMKKKPKQEETQDIKISSDGFLDIRSISKDKKPLIVIDGEINSNTDILFNIDPAQIKEVSVLKGDLATDKYGDQGKNGVILITLKKETAN